MTAGERKTDARVGAANERFKERYGEWLWGSITLAVALHFAIVLAWPSMSVADVSMSTTALSTVELPPEIEVPPEPEAVPRPARPVIADVEVDQDITIPETTFESNPVDELPPPVASDDADLAAAPSFTPFEVAPRLINEREVQRTLLRYYPDLYKDAGIEGTVVLWFFINEEGRVINTRLVRSSGYDDLDRAGMRVAEMMRFSPAQNRDKKVPVWIQLPVIFEVMK